MANTLSKNERRNLTLCTRKNASESVRKAARSKLIKIRKKLAAIPKTHPYYRKAQQFLKENPEKTADSSGKTIPGHQMRQPSTPPPGDPAKKADVKAGDSKVKKKAEPKKPAEKKAEPKKKASEKKKDPDSVKTRTDVPAQRSTSSAPPSDVDLAGGPKHTDAYAQQASADKKGDTPSASKRERETPTDPDLKAVSAESGEGKEQPKTDKLDQFRRWLRIYYEETHVSEKRHRNVKAFLANYLARIRTFPKDDQCYPLARRFIAEIEAEKRAAAVKTKESTPVSAGSSVNGGLEPVDKDAASPSTQTEVDEFKRKSRTDAFRLFGVGMAIVLCIVVLVALVYTGKKEEGAFRKGVKERQAKIQKGDLTDKAESTSEIKPTDPAASDKPEAESASTQESPPSGEQKAEAEAPATQEPATETGKAQISEPVKTVEAQPSQVSVDPAISPGSISHRLAVLEDHIARLRRTVKSNSDIFRGHDPAPHNHEFAEAKTWDVVRGRAPWLDSIGKPASLEELQRLQGDLSRLESSLKEHPKSSEINELKRQLNALKGRIDGLPKPPPAVNEGSLVARAKQGMVLETGLVSRIDARINEMRPIKPPILSEADNKRLTAVETSLGELKSGLLASAELEKKLDSLRKDLAALTSAVGSSGQPSNESPIREPSVQQDTVLSSTSGGSVAGDSSPEPRNPATLRVEDIKDDPRFVKLSQWELEQYVKDYNAL